ncbi:inositol-trisphosphate 3-kinase A [Megalops cyprinoides]|uniref:inositol-trisphosphate 3-kinase A n=1 Tax=Megalops cyprinoides TaxID=118141 RepID=UPI001864F90A|nr:inositol-trisphosphate 3-kinase A [Megalops cyprinoides]
MERKVGRGEKSKMAVRLCVTVVKRQQSVLSSGEPETQARAQEAAKPERGPAEKCLDQNPVPDSREEGEEDRRGNTEKEGKEGISEEREEEGESEKDRGAGPRRSVSKMRDNEKEKWKARRRERPGVGMEEKGERERERSRQCSCRAREWDGALVGQEELRRERETETVMWGVGAEGDIERQGSMRRTILTRMLMHSSSSSSSSFNCSSAESDEVPSEGEEMATRRQTMRKSRSWKTFLNMMQWSVRRQSSWVQLAGHHGNFHLSEGGEVLKRFNAVENACLQALMSDTLRQFVPRYHGLASRGGESYIRLEDLLSGLSCPVIMDCKMGVRTYLEEELTKAQLNPCLRSDMYQKMVKVDPMAPSAEEHAQGGVTKLCYMHWRDSVSSTSTLGFRIEGVTVEDGSVLRDFKKTRSFDQVIDVLLFFTKRQSHILEAYLSRLQALNEALKVSEFFQNHEIIGSSLLFVHDCSKANIWMIDFAKTIPMPPGICLKHNVPWVEGNREDGYLIGLASLILLVMEALRLTHAQDADHQPESQVVPHHGEATPVPGLLSATSTDGFETLPNDGMSEPSGNGPQLTPEPAQWASVVCQNSSPRK